MTSLAKPSTVGVLSSAAGCMVAAFLVTSLGEGIGAIPMPSFLATSMSIVPGPFYAHIFACCLGVVVAVASFTAAQSRRPHRTIGQIAFLFLLVGAIASIPVAVTGTSQTIAKVAFVGQALTLIGSILFGWYAGRRGNLRLHRVCVAFVALALSGAPLSRIILKMPDPWLGPEAGYAAVAWISWIVPFAMALTVKVCLRSRDPMNGLLAGR